MAIFQPSNITPSNFAGVGLGTVDATDNVQISWQVNGNSPMTAFQIQIYDNTQPNNLTPIYDTGTIITGIPEGGFYGVDGNGNIQRFVYEPINTTTNENYNWSDWGLVNGNEYKMYITQYWGARSENSIEQSSASVFLTRTTPQLAIDIPEDVDVGSGRLYFLKNDLSQGNYYFEWAGGYNYNFTLPENLLSTDIIILSQPLGYYRKNNEWKTMSVDFSIQNIGINAMNSLKYIAFFPLSNAPITTFIVDYTQSQDDAIDTVLWQIFLLDEEKSDESAAPRSGQLVYEIGPLNTQQLQFNPNFLQQNTIYIVKCTIVTQNGITVEDAITYFIYYANFDFNNETYSCCNLSDGSVYLDINSTDNEIEKIAIYSQSNYINKLLYNNDTFGGNQQIKLFSFPSNTSPLINIFGINSVGQYSNPTIININNFHVSSYFLYETKQDVQNPDVYHVVKTWRFGNNITIGSVSNNNTPNWLTNFTPYRLKQPSSRLGKSGTLQALLSNYNQTENFYEDTALMMEELYQASTSLNTFFLKDIKGNLYMVGISAPIVQTINTKTKVQEVKVSIPWEEVGDAQNISLIQLPTDSGWQQDQVFDAMFDVDITTGLLSVTYPQTYRGTTFNLSNNNLIATTPIGVSKVNLSIKFGAVIATTENTGNN